ncbi:autophagy-related protein 18g-like isoform X2 [Wolffia australiana]
MRNEEASSGKRGGFFSLRNVSGYLRIVSSGASNVASTVKSAGAAVASSILERDGGGEGDQVKWAGFDKLEVEGEAVHQIHCFDALNLKKEYTILSNPVPSRSIISGSVANVPLALGPRWLAYSGSPAVVLDGRRVSPEDLSPARSLSSSSSSSIVVSKLAKLGHIGYKKLSKYCSELLPDGTQGNDPILKANDFHEDDDSSGMVIVRDVLSKSVLAQFKAHSGPISALCFDPSGTLLATASILGHNINVFCILSSSPGSETRLSYVHLYRLQRGLTNAVIQDISFSNDSQWIMISSARGTSHLFAIKSPENFKLLCKHPNDQESPGRSTIHSSLPITLSVFSRIRNENWWRSTMNGMVAATGRAGVFTGIIASAFHDCTQLTGFRKEFNLLVFCPSGSLIQYVLPDTVDDAEVVVEATRKWDICQKKIRRDGIDDSDMYGKKRGRRGFSSKPVFSPEERRHLYISEVEFWTHTVITPLWAKSKISFHAWMNLGVLHETDGSFGGETAIEQIPTHAIVARAKDLIPVIGSFQVPS